MRRNSACAQRSQDHPSSTSSSRRSALPNKVEARGDVQEANLSKILYEGERGEKKYGKENNVIFIFFFFRAPGARQGQVLSRALFSFLF
jgi:hypothetical protein